MLFKWYAYRYYPHRCHLIPDKQVLIASVNSDPPIASLWLSENAYYVHFLRRI